MSMAATAPLVAVDVGNSRLKFGLFQSRQTGHLPQPDRVVGVEATQGDLDALIDWLLPCKVQEVDWRIASVNRPAASRLIDWLGCHQATGRTRMIAAGDLDLEVSLPAPDKVGIDRLLAAVAANRLRAGDCPAVIVDLGTAITVDAVSGAGAFLGGAILPGISMSARALHEFTDLLPLLDMDQLSSSPPPLGTSTIDAMRAGLFWGAIGAARELLQRFVPQVGADPHIFLTGGAALSVARLIRDDATFEPHLVLAGIAMTNVV